MAEQKSAVAIPANPMCHADAPDVTLNSAHAMMELIIALNCDDGASEFEMPESINVTLGPHARLGEGLDQVRGEGVAAGRLS
jgi:hypothetical protein